MSNTSVVENAKDHVWHHLTQHKAFESNDPLVVSNANGMIITDSKGDEYLDATSGGVWTVNLGYGRDEMVKVVSDQISKIPYFAGAFGNEPASEYAQEITSLMPGMNRVYYSNSGSEANEKGYKMVRQLAHFDNDGKKHKIIFRDRDYHGTTIGAMSSSAQIQRKKQYGPFVGKLSPIPSTKLAMVEAVPMVMQTPEERLIPVSAAMNSLRVISPALTSSEKRQTSVPDPMSLPLYFPLSIGPAETTIVGRSTLAAPISWPGVVLSQPPKRTTPSIP